MVKRANKAAMPKKILGGRKINRSMPKGAKPDTGSLMRMTVKSGISNKLQEA